MPEYAAAHIEIKDLSKGLNTFDPETQVPAGYYVDCQNMLLTNKTPITISGLSKLNTTAAPNTRLLRWGEPYTDAAGVTTFLVATDAGAAHADGAGIYEYNIVGDTWTPQLHQIDNTATLFSHVPFRGQLLFSNGADDVMKFDGTNVLPVGGNLLVDMESDEDAQWDGNSTIVTTAGDRKEGTQSRSVTTVGAAVASRLTYPASRDFQAGLGGAPNFTATVPSDLFEVWIKRTAGTGAISLAYAIETTAGVNSIFFTDTFTPTGNWERRSIPLSSFSIAGAPNLANINSIAFQVSSFPQTILFDWSYLKYRLAPPVGSLIEMYAQQLVVAGIPTDRVKLVYSDPNTVDYFPALNFARFSGGRHALEKTDQITALWSYFDELIVGKVNSAWTFSGTGVNVSISALPLTIGIDSNRAICETPWSLQYLFENNIFGARLTSRGLVSTNITSLLGRLDATHADKVVSIRHDRTHSVRWSFRTLDTLQAANDLGLLYDYQLDAWMSKYTPAIRYYTRAIVNGAREIIVLQYDGFIRRADVGSSFDGVPIESYVTLPWTQVPDPETHGDITRWVDLTVNLAGTASVSLDARFADEPHEFASAVFQSFGTVGPTPDGDKGYCYFGKSSRFIQVRLRATALSFETKLPILIGYIPSKRRV